MGTVIETGRKMAAQSHANQHRGAGVKNLGPNAEKRPNPAPQIRGLSPNLMGPDKGAGGK